MTAKKPCTSAAHIGITDEMLTRQAPSPPPAAVPIKRTNDLAADEVREIFVQLRALKATFGPKPNKNDLATALIGACIYEGFDTRLRIIRALQKLDLDRSHVVLTLEHNEGTDPSHHLWQLDGDGRYHLHGRARPPPAL